MQSASGGRRVNRGLKDRLYGDIFPLLVWDRVTCESRSNRAECGLYSDVWFYALKFKTFETELSSSDKFKEIYGIQMFFFFGFFSYV